jgi:hypothetical protein
MSGKPAASCVCNETLFFTTSPWVRAMTSRIAWRSSIRRQFESDTPIHSPFASSSRAIALRRSRRAMQKLGLLVLGVCLIYAARSPV